MPRTVPAVGRDHSAGRPDPFPETCPVCDDPRIVAFAWFVRALDLLDATALRRETRELRKLGFSVCLTGSTASKGGA